MATAPKSRVDVDIHNLLMDSSREPIRPAALKGMTLPGPVYPQYPEKLAVRLSSRSFCFLWRSAFYGSRSGRDNSIGFA